MRISVAADERTGVADAIVEELRRRGHEVLVHGALRADEEKKDAPKTESVDFRKLKELMPAELSGLKRATNNGERTKVGDVSITLVGASVGPHIGPGAVGAAILYRA